MILKRVVVTGMGAITPVGNSTHEFWEALMKGESGAAAITLFDASLFKTRFACEVKNFDPIQHFDKKEVKKLDRYSQLGLVSVEEAVKDAGIMNNDRINFERVGTIWATGIGGFETFENELIEFEKNQQVPRFNPFFIVKMIPNMISGLISIRYGLKAMSYVTVSACASSNNAFVDAFNFIKLGKADVIIAGGSEAPITRASVGGFNAMKALSERNDDPTSACRPFDVDRDGFVLGEGGGALVLEELEHAKKRGAKIYAEFLSSGLSSDAYHVTATDPEGAGAYRALKEALREAGLSANDVDYINMHATSTHLGDASELKAVQKCFGESPSLNVSSTKSMTGHLLGGAGAIEAVAAIMAINKGIIPPTINLHHRDPELPAHINITPNEAVNKTVNVAISNTFGFGGHNTSVLFKKFEE